MSADHSLTLLGATQAGGLSTSTLLAMFFWNVGVQKIGGLQSGIFMNFIPVFTALLAFLLLGERIGEWQWIGTVIVIAGTYLFTTIRARERYREPSEKRKFL